MQPQDAEQARYMAVSGGVERHLLFSRGAPLPIRNDSEPEHAAAASRAFGQLYKQSARVSQHFWEFMMRRGSRRS